MSLAMLRSGVPAARWRAGGGGGGGGITGGAGGHLAADVRVRDVAGGRRDGVPGCDLTEAYGSEVPGGVGGVLSRATMGKGGVRKLPRYGAAGVRYAWLLDPLACTLGVCEGGGGRWSLASTHGGTDECRPPPFVDVPLTLSDLWLPAE